MPLNLHFTAKKHNDETKKYKTKLQNIRISPSSSVGNEFGDEELGSLWCLPSSSERCFN
jgi:hypothetical protein